MREDGRNLGLVESLDAGDGGWRVGRVDHVGYLEQIPDVGKGAVEDSVAWWIEKSL
jgi:hypothetical protein